MASTAAQLARMVTLCARVVLDETFEFEVTVYFDPRDPLQHRHFNGLGDGNTPAEIIGAAHDWLVNRVAGAGVASGHRPLGGGRLGGGE